MESSRNFHAPGRFCNDTAEWKRNLCPERDAGFSQTAAQVSTRLERHFEGRWKSPEHASGCGARVCAVPDRLRRDTRGENQEFLRDCVGAQETSHTSTRICCEGKVRILRRRLPVGCSTTSGDRRRARRDVRCARPHTVGHRIARQVPSESGMREASTIPSCFATIGF